MEKKRRFPLFKKPTITQEEFDKIKENSEAARELLKDKRFKFFRDYLHNSRQSIIEAIVNNNIKNVEEANVISETVTKVFKISKKEQIEELSGKYKFISGLLDDLTTIANNFNDLQEAIKQKKVIVKDERE